MNHDDRFSPTKRFPGSSAAFKRLADYFAVCGYSTQVQRGGLPCGVLLQRFPTKDWDDEAFICDIEAFCQPLGWSLATERKEPKFFICVLTDMYGTRRYCACLSFFEPIAITPSKPVDERREIKGTRLHAIRSISNGTESRRLCLKRSRFEIHLQVSDKSEDEDIDGSGDNMLLGYPSSSFHTVMYAPKVLVLQSRLNLSETFRHCLGTIYTIYSEANGPPLETLIGTLLGHEVPPAGGPQFRFSIGGGDRQALQPPLNDSIPATNSTVATLFHQIGINNVLTLLCAVMTEQKILFHSKSSTRLYDACHALAALMYPFKWLHTFIPLLPILLAEIAQSPTPFMIGILSEAREAITEKLNDVIVVDLDGGSITIPEASPKVHQDGKMNSEKQAQASSSDSKPSSESPPSFVPRFPESLWNQVFELLTMVLHPELTSSDFAFPPLVVKTTATNLLDKEIRAILMKMLAQLFQGYRSCLVIIRINPSPVITFHRAKFLGERGLSDNLFVCGLLGSQCFNQFIADRGSPWRTNDIWDDLYSTLLEQLQSEARDPKLAMIHIKEIAQQLALNESPNSQTHVTKIVRPPEGAHTRIHAPVFPNLNGAVIQEIIREAMSKQPLPRFNGASKLNQPRIVPVGPKVTEFDQRKLLVDNSARRLEVLRNCISCIFENKISDARKSIHAVTRALKNNSAKLVLCEELGRHVTGNKAMLEPQQFDLVVKLMHCALQETSEADEHGVAFALLPLATSFCRKLCTGVIQFAYSCIQDHPVWRNQQFWESAFYSDVQKDIKALYTPRLDNSLYNNNYSVISNPDKPKELPSPVFTKPVEYTALDIAAEQLRLACTIDSEKMKELINSEESTLYSQAIHYANRMVYLLVPLDTPTKKHKEMNNHHHHHHHHHNTDNISNITSVAESDSVGGESGFEDHEPVIESGMSVARLVTRFVDKVCSEGGVTEDHVRALHSMIPGVVDMHVETLEGVNRESKRLPTVHKPKVPSPLLLPGEELVIESMRVYLLADGRELGETVGGLGEDGLTNHNKSPLPAEGALFFTNYRLVFKGTPCDQSSSVPVVIRSFPITSLTKEKRFAVQYIAHLDQKIQEGLQIRSATCQLMKLAFDEEVTSETIEAFRKLLTRHRYPPDIFQYFAFAGQSLVAPVPLHSNKDKNATLKLFARTLQKVGVKPKRGKHKYTLRTWAQGNGGTLPASTKYMTGGSSTTSSPMRNSPPSRDGLDGDEISLGSTGSLSTVSDDDFPQTPLTNTLSSPTSDAKSIERTLERSYCKDWRRLGLGSQARNAANSPATAILSRAESFRFSYVNCAYNVCRAYPALVVVPSAISDESLKKLSHCYTYGKFPVITWRHPMTRALLLRASAWTSKGLASRVFGTQKTQGGSGMSDAGAHIEQENFLRAIINATPLVVQKSGSGWGLAESNLSLDSLLTTSTVVGHSHLHKDSHSALPSQITPEVGRKGPSNPFIKAMDTLRYGGTSGGKGIKNYKNWTGSRPRKVLPVPVPTTGIYKTAPKLIEREAIITESIHKAALYVFLEKSKIKGLKAESNSKIEYIPVIQVPDLRETRSSFKLLMRAAVPSSTVVEPQESFLRAFETSEWLVHLSSIMQLTGAVVDLLDIQGSSVMLCLGDGADINTQVTALAQLCLDPYYRTIEGFHALIEKEWLAFGHRFSDRNNMTGTEGYKSTHLITPIFIQFLDIVHQMHKQFPLSFEFNQYYIKFLAYHSISARFRTFLLDTEYERVAYGFMVLDDKRGSLPRHYKGVDNGSDDENFHPAKQLGSNSHQSNMGQSIFDYIDKVHAKAPIFYNFLYDKDCDIQVLRPMCNLANLDPWEYYLTENLTTGSPYDIEVVNLDAYLDLHDEELPSDPASAKDNRRLVSTEFDIIENHIPDSFKYTLAEIYRLEASMQRLPQKWKQVWDKLESQGPPEESCWTRQASLTTQMVRTLGRAFHKRYTVDILVRGKMVRSADLSSMIHSHRFEKHTFTTLANCDSCGSILLGKTALKCADCGTKCHEKCTEGVIKCPGKHGKSVTEGSNGSSGPKTTSVAEPNSPTPTSSPAAAMTLQTAHHSYYDQFQSNIAENRTHEGYLYKRGALLKGWKQRWFVLDSIKHQLRYYDAMEDSHSKGCIDLSEVNNVTLGYPTQGAPKKVDDKSFFDIRTTRRSYNFCACDANSAQDWIEKIQACL